MERNKRRSQNNMPATLADIQAKYGDSVYPLYKDEMHAPYMEEDTMEDPIVKFDNQVATLKSFNIPKKEIAKHLKTDRSKVNESLGRSHGEVKEVKKISIGYKGVVLHDKEEDKVLCAECGQWFSNLGKHLNGWHKTTTDEYRDKHGLNKNVALCSKKISNKLSQRASEVLSNYAFIKNDPRITGVKQEKKHKEERLEKMKKTKKEGMMVKNRYGLCDAQIAARLVIVRDMVGKERIEDLTSRDFSKYDINLYQAMRNRYGSFRLACKSLGINYIGQNKYAETEMISGLRKFVMANNRLPLTKKELGHKGLASYDTIKARFGSWRRAKMMAGLDQLLQEIKGN